ncbi:MULTISPECIES: VOC family protein [Bacillaceae]|uniref:VOC domain-containing protein n=1 Tax=Alkalicoccobacillus plakortidis TaxID=444060 RepID=A0A9D5I2M3_9BACI|nr:MULTISPECIES: VOC family protein [Bacillaceae]KQL57938.1 hypothetical protein AN965_06350 [Alkalicoccobacillus plakortidis]
MLDIKLDHIAYVVKSKEEIARFFSLFAATEGKQERIQEQQVTVYHVQVGSFSIELLLPFPENHSLQRYVARHPSPCFHHLALLSSDLQMLQDVLEQNGYEFIYEKAKIGSKGKRINFIKPACTNDVLIELCEHQT